MDTPTSLPADSQDAGRDRWRRVGLGVLMVVIVGLGAARLMHLTADPPVRNLGRVASFYGDEGVWYGASLWFVEHGRLYLPGDYNPVVLMPVMPTLVGVVAAATGLEVWFTARLITALLMMGATAALIVALAPRAGWGAALLTGLLLTASFTFFVYSRLALLDVPAVAWVVLGLCLLLGWRQRRPTWATVAAALIGCLAVLSKSSMLLAMPAYLVAAWMTPNPDTRRWRDPLIIGVLGVALVGGYAAAAVVFFPQDTVDFRRANISVGDRSPWEKVIRFLKAGRFMGPGFYALATLAVPLALWRLRRHPAYPWVVAGVVWVVLMSLGVATKDIAVTRYYLPLMPALAVIIAAAVAAGTRPTTRLGRALRTVGTVAVLLISAHGGASIVAYLRQPAYTFQRMGQDLARQIEQLDPQTPWVIYGPWPSNSAALAAGVPPLSLSSSPAEGMLAAYPPAYLVTRGPRAEAIDPEPLRALRRHYAFGEERTYRVLPGMFAATDPLFHAVRLHPKPTAPTPGNTGKTGLPE